jgi:hypothetical protein
MLAAAACCCWLLLQTHMMVSCAKDMLQSVLRCVPTCEADGLLEQLQAVEVLQLASLVHHAEVQQPA